MKSSQELDSLFKRFKDLINNKNLNSEKKTEELINILKETDIELKK